MRFVAAIALFIAFMSSGYKCLAQEDTLVQTVRGQVTDAESKNPLPGVIILVLPDKKLHAMTDADGNYRLDNVPVGRQSFEFRYTGFDTKNVSEVPVTSGKELELNVALTETVRELHEATVVAIKDRIKSTNEFAQVSARSFNVEETKRFAASVSDPARLAQNFAGVANNGDLDNDIVVRGNSPKGILWRLEGIEIPNPNHYSDLGNGGGSISMLNASTLGTSDFYTGAFPPEIGNALSSAFDLSFRNGNKDKYEHSIQIGVMGTELATEGPFRRGGQSSYLVEYRYSTLTLLKNYLNLGGIIPDYQDASFKLNFPTKKAGTITVFGLGGINNANKDPGKDSTTWNDDNPNFVLNSVGRMGIIGVTHQYFVSKNAYIKTIISGSYDDYNKDVDTLNKRENYNHVLVDKAFFANTAYRFSFLYNNKLNARNTIRTGIVAQQLAYDLDENFYDYGSKTWKNILNGQGSTQYYQAYVQWKYRLTSKISLVSGIHTSYYALNKKSSFEPRASLSYQLPKSRITFAAGLHSKPEHISTYLFRDSASAQSGAYPNIGLDLVRAAHLVAGYETQLPWKLRMKAEAYYQYLYNIPVEKDSASGFSIINTESIFGLYDTKPLVSAGTGMNYGIDLSVERPFIDNFYMLFTGSLFRTTYTAYNGAQYQGHFDRGYQLNLVGGKEFKVNKKGRSLIGLNGKVLYSGGQRETPIDVSASQAAGRTVYVAGQYFTNQDPYYFRIDGSIYYKINNKKATHSLQLDVQNVTNRLNYYYQYYDNRDGRVKDVKQVGILPVISYRVEFHR